jgi:hypothetical protein
MTSVIRRTVAGWRRVVSAVFMTSAIAGAFSVTAVRADETSDASRPGMTYESIARLPDFSGWWYLDLDPNNVADSLNVVFTAYAPLLKPEIAERVKALATLPDPEKERGPGYCSPMIFTGFNGGFEDSVELLFTPGRVTITSELGLLRRVYLYRALPADAEVSAMGTSVGHWEGSTLVVETTGLDRNGFLMRGVKVGSKARIVERISLEDQDTLKIARRVVAPDALTGPSEMTLVFLRDRDHVFHEASHCVEDDRSVDHETGQERFDLTPPADLLPPPPAR